MPSPSNLVFTFKIGPTAHWHIREPEVTVIYLLIIHNFLDIFDSSSSDDDELDRSVHRIKVYRFRRDVSEYNYRKLFRFSRPNVAILVNTFFPPYYETRGGALNNIRKMEIFLHHICISYPRFHYNFIRSV